MNNPTLSVTLLPIHTKPKDDELLSSWLVRLAKAYGLKLHTFCSLVFPGKQIWNRDIDKSADIEIIKILSEKTATPIQRAKAATLAAYEQVLYEKHNHYGPTSWIMPIGVYHRTRRQFGLQCCPLCLVADKEPYYRRRWRLAFMVVCNTHGVMLYDRCPACQAAINFHRNELGSPNKFTTSSLNLCYNCNYEFTAIRSTSISYATPAEIEFTNKLLRTMRDGYIRINEDVVAYSHLYFSVLRQLMKILAMRSVRIEKLREDVCDAYGLENYAASESEARIDMQELNVRSRRQLLGIAQCLLNEWPYSFIEAACRNKVWSSTWLRHWGSGARDQTQIMPFWFWSVIHDHLYRARYHPSDEEIAAAIAHLKQTGKVLNNSALSRLLGIAILRKDIAY